MTIRHDSTGLDDPLSHSGRPTERLNDLRQIGHEAARDRRKSRPGAAPSFRMDPTIGVHQSADQLQALLRGAAFVDFRNPFRVRAHAGDADAAERLLDGATTPAPPSGSFVDERHSESAYAASI